LERPASGAIERGWAQAVRGTRWLGCQTCKLALVAFVTSAVLNIGALIAAGTAAGEVLVALHAAQQVLLDILKDVMTLDGGQLPHIVDLIAAYAGGPIDRVLHEICSCLRLS
jgi:hypothetical protein